MSLSHTPPQLEKTNLPDHTQLPCEDGTFAKNFQEHPQSFLLTDCIAPILEQLRPDKGYCIGQDSGIYWRLTQPPEPPERGAEAPDWFLVLNVPPTLDGEIRRSYVLWKEHIPPILVLEFVSGDGSEERDTTPWTGKFWIYENVIRPAFYGIYEVRKASVEVDHLIEDHYELLPANERGHFPIAPLGVELGIWRGKFFGATLPWMRFWDNQGNLLLTGFERAEQKRHRAEQESQRAQQERLRAEQAESQLAQERQKAELERQRAERLANRLRSLGIDPDTV